MSWLLPAVLIAALAIAVVVSLLLVAGVLVRESRAPRAMTDDDFACWAGDPMCPSTWPHAGTSSDGAMIQRAPIGEDIVIETDGRIVSIADHLAGRAS